MHIIVWDLKNKVEPVLHCDGRELALEAMLAEED
jgi:hypothetical protein